MKSSTRIFVPTAAVLSMALCVTTFAASPPMLVNYQGVLRDAAGAPEEDPFDMVFRFYDTDGGAPPCPAAGGTLLLTDSHTSIDSIGPVTVSGGLFDVRLGEGTLTAGAAATLGEVFRDDAGVYLEVEIAGETLCPRIRVVSSAYALNAGTLGGVEPSGYLDTSAAAQVKTGDLAVADLTVSGDDLQFGVGGSIANHIVGFPLIDQDLSIVADDVSEFADLLLVAGNSSDDGSITLNGQGSIDLRSGDDTFSFFNSAGTETANLGASGSLQIDGDLTLSGTEIFSPGAIQLKPNSDVITILDIDNNNVGIDEDWCNHNCTGVNQLMELQEGGNLRVNGSVLQDQFDLAEAYLAGEPLTSGDVVRLDPDRKGAVLLSAGENDWTVLGVVSEDPGVVLGDAPFGLEELEQEWGAEMKTRFLEVRERLLADHLSRNPEIGERLRSLQRAAQTAQDDAQGSGGAAAEQNENWELAALLADVDHQVLETFYWNRFVPVALAGRTPVTVDAGFGPIAPGDSLAPSPVAGVAMKADGRGPVIGIALEGLSEGRGKVEAFISRGQVPMERIVKDQDRLAEDLQQRTPNPVTGIQEHAGHFQVVLDRDADDEARFSVLSNGGGALVSEVFRVDEQGNVFAKGAFRPASMDVAEYFALSEPAEAGHVLVVDRDSPGHCRLGRITADTAVVGVVAAEPGVILGSGVARIAASDSELAAQLDLARNVGDRRLEGQAWKELEAAFLQTHAPVALTGTVQVKADAGYGAIRVGDLLTTSPTPGHAMRADEPLPGTILGKALEPLETGTGMIRVLVMLR